MLFFDKKVKMNNNEYKEILTYIKRLNGLATKTQRINVETYESVNDYLTILNSKLRKINEQIDLFSKKLDDKTEKYEKYTIPAPDTKQECLPKLGKVSMYVVYKKLKDKNIVEKISTKINNTPDEILYACCRTTGMIPGWLIARSMNIGAERVCMLNIKKIRTPKKNGFYDYKSFETLVKSNKKDYSSWQMRKFLERRDYFRKILKKSYEIGIDDLDLDFCEQIFKYKFSCEPTYA